MKVDVYNMEGKKAGNATIADAVFAMPFNADLVHQVVVAMQANARDSAPGAHTKDRSEVRGGGKKPWRQKGTGRARHGSSRSPIWVGGGVTHGPRKDKIYAQKINKKMRVKALFATLSQKVTDGEMFFVDTLSFDEPKTQKARGIVVALAKGTGLSALADKKHNTALIVVPEVTEMVKKSFQNIGNVMLIEARNVNPVDVLSYKYVIVIAPEASSDVFIARMEGKMRGVKRGMRNEDTGAENASKKKTAVKKVASKKKVATKKATSKSKGAVKAKKTTK